MLHKLFNKFNIFFILVSLVFSSCIFIKAVKIQKIEKIEVSKLSLTSAILNLYLKIDNPNIFKIRITDIDLDVMIENEHIGSIQETEDIELQANSEQVVIVKLNVSFSNVISKAFRIVKLLSRQDANIKLTGTIQTKSFIITKTIHIEEEDLVSLF